MAQPPQATAPVPALDKSPRYTMETLPPGLAFDPNGRYLLDHYLVPRALHGRVPDDVLQDAVADGVDVYAVQPEALPFPSRQRGTFDRHDEVWGYFFAKRPAAAGSGVGGSDSDDVRDVAAGGCWWRYGSEKAYIDNESEAYAFRNRFAFYEPTGGGKLTPWRMKEFRVDEAAAAFRGVTFHPSAKDLVVLKVCYKVEIPEEEPGMDYYSSDDDDENGAKKITVGDAIAGSAATAA